MASSKEPSSNDSEPKEAGELIASNYDLASQILLRLPARSLAALRLASKQWCSITSDPYFITSHIRYNPPLLSGFLLYYFGRPKASSSHRYVALEPKKTDNTPLQFVGAQNSLDLRIIQSCNGLLLCATSDSRYYICNPTTLQRKQISLPKTWLAFGPVSLSLAFDPKKSCHYKVVSVRRFCEKEPMYQVEVYSSESGLWKATGDPMNEVHDDFDFKHGVFCKGAIHWLKAKSSSCLYYDVDKECLKSTPEPPRAKQFNASECEYFGQSNDRLYLVVRRHLPSFMLFEMEDDYSGWFMKCLIDLEFLAKKFPSMARNFYNTPVFSRIYECNVLCVVENGIENENSCVNLVVCIPGEIVYFNPLTKASKTIAYLTIGPFDESAWFRDFILHEYFETFCPARCLFVH